jgi:hypothetical protein
LKLSALLVIALFTNQISAVQLESQNLIDTSCPDGDSIPIKIKHKHHGGGKLKKVLKAIADTEEEEPKVSVVRVPAPSCPAAAKEEKGGCDAKKDSAKEGAEEAGKKAGKEAKKAVEKALKK